MIHDQMCMKMHGVLQTFQRRVKVDFLSMAFMSQSLETESYPILRIGDSM